MGLLYNNPFSVYNLLGIIASEIKKIVDIMPEQIFIISGHAADIPGHEKGEMELSTQRAERVKNILIKYGVPLKNIQCIYNAGTNKWGDNLSEETRKQNRVVTIELRK
jgi:outer membrane protein OmpA-like peptidoglycan-associated protein